MKLKKKKRSTLYELSAAMILWYGSTLNLLLLHFLHTSCTMDPYPRQDSAPKICRAITLAYSHSLLGVQLFGKNNNIV